MENVNLEETSPDWIVKKISMTSEGKRVGKLAKFPIRVEGINLSQDGRSFIWDVPSVADRRYDISQAIIEPGAASLLYCGWLEDGGEISSTGEYIRS